MVRRVYMSPLSLRLSTLYCTRCILHSMWGEGGGRYFAKEVAPVACRGIFFNSVSMQRFLRAACVFVHYYCGPTVSNVNNNVSFLHVSGVQTAVTAAPVLPKKEESGVLMVMNLPDSLTDDHVRELLSPFGELKRFNLLKVRVWGRRGGGGKYVYNIYGGRKGHEVGY